MAQVTVRVGGRAYAIDCRAGEEARVRELAAALDARAARLTEALGVVGEGRLLLSVAMLVADELGEAEAAMAAAADRIESIATALEAEAANH